MKNNWMLRLLVLGEMLALVLVIAAGIVTGGWRKPEYSTPDTVAHAAETQADIDEALRAVLQNSDLTATTGQ